MSVATVTAPTAGARASKGLARTAGTAVAVVVLQPDAPAFVPGDELTFHRAQRLLGDLGFVLEPLNNAGNRSTPRRRLVDWPRNMSRWERQRLAVACCASGAKARPPRRHIIEVATGRELPPLPRRPRYPSRRKR